MSHKQPFYKIILSVLAALLGVQSSQKAGQDFKEPGPWMFILIGIVFVLILIFGLIFVVSTVAP